MFFFISFLVILTGTAAAQTEATADSTQGFPPRAKYRSTAESIAAVPGLIVYLPIGVGSYILSKGFSLVYEKHLIERLNNLLTFYDGRAGIHLLSSSGLGSGLDLYFNGLLGAKANFITTLGASPSQRRHHQFSLAWPSQLKITAQYSKDPKKDFNGIGNNTQKADKTSFKQEDVLVQATYRKQLGPASGLDLGLHYEAIDTAPGKSESAPPLRLSTRAAPLPGLEERAHFVGAGIALRTNQVDTPGSPTRGHRTIAHLTYNVSVDDSEFSHLRAVLIGEKFFELFYRRTFALRLGSDWRYAPGGHRVPFYNFAQLGGVETLRGYRLGRFRDRGVVFGTATYKFPIWELVEGALFYDVGRTFDKPGDFELADWKNSFGGSLRLWLPSALLGQLTFAHSSESNRILFNFKTIFQ